MKAQHKLKESTAREEAERRAAKKHREINRKLDQALEDTFPGSDPVSISQPPHSSKDKDAV
jgi:hypothetical protein